MHASFLKIMEVFDTDRRMPIDFIRMQYAAIDNLCEAFDALIKGATLRFYPYGGSLYRMFMPRSTSEYTKTNDVDGFLMVVPDDVTLEDCLTTSPSRYENTVNRIVDTYEVLFETIFNLQGIQRWCTAASTRDFTLSCPQFVSAYTGGTGADTGFVSGKVESRLVKPFDREEMRNSILSVKWANTVFNDVFPIRVQSTANSDYSTEMDVHFGVLQPVTDFYTGRTCEIVQKARPHAFFRHVHIQSLQTFFIEQARTMIECLVQLYEELILHPEKEHAKRLDALTKQMLDRGSALTQSLVKAKKRVMRVNELVMTHYDLANTSLVQIYATHDTDIFAPISQTQVGHGFQRSRVEERLQPYILKSEVESFNNMLLWGYKGDSVHTEEHQLVSDDEAKNSSLAKALQQPLRKMLNIMHISHGNEVSNAFILSNDVTTKEMMHLLTFLYERMEDKVNEVMRTVASNGPRYKLKVERKEYAEKYLMKAARRAGKKETTLEEMYLRRQREAQDKFELQQADRWERRRRAAAGGGEEKRGEAQFAQEIHAFKLMNRMNLRF